MIGKNEEKPGTKTFCSQSSEIVKLLKDFEISIRSQDITLGLYRDGTISCYWMGNSRTLARYS